MGKRIVTTGASVIAAILKQNPDIPEDVEVLMVTTRMECPSAVRILCSSKEWPTTEEGEPLPKMEFP